LDHSSIYLLIAGTYTPFVLLTLQGSLGWTFFFIIWGCAVVGISLEAFWVNRPKIVSSIVYLAMGWIIVFIIGPLRDGLNPVGFQLLFIGGAAYTIGAIVYALKHLKWSHPIWHVFVLAGSACHFFAVQTIIL
jgi:hemolysin III